MTILIVYSTLRTDFGDPALGQVFAPMLRSSASGLVFCVHKNIIYWLTGRMLHFRISWLELSFGKSS